MNTALWAEKRSSEQTAAQSYSEDSKAGKHQEKLCFYLILFTWLYKVKESTKSLIHGTCGIEAI